MQARKQTKSGGFGKKSHREVAGKMTINGAMWRRNFGEMIDFTRSQFSQK
jgi:hypothetical protein